jgi:hypothetical protein
MTKVRWLDDVLQDLTVLRVTAWWEKAQDRDRWKGCYQGGQGSQMAVAPDKKMIQPQLLTLSLNILETNTTAPYNGKSHKQDGIHFNLQYPAYSGNADPFTRIRNAIWLIIDMVEASSFVNFSINVVIYFFKRASFLSIRSRDSAVGMATDYGMDGRWDGVWVSVGTTFFSFPRRSDRFWGSPRYCG